MTVTDAQRFRAQMAKAGDTQAKLAAALGLPLSAVNNRIHGRVEWRRHEMTLIRKRYKLTDAETVELFFSSKVS